VNQVKKLSHKKLARRQIKILFDGARVCQTSAAEAATTLK